MPDIYTVCYKSKDLVELSAHYGAQMFYPLFFMGMHCSKRTAVCLLQGLLHRLGPIYLKKKDLYLNKTGCYTCVVNFIK